MISAVKLGQIQEVRWMRSFLLAALTACTAGLAHAGGGGHRTPIWLLIALTAAGTPAMHGLSGKRWRFGHIVAVMGLTQIALHAAMSMSMPAGHEHAAAIHPVASSATTSMVLLHVGTTLALAFAVAFGERVLDWTVRRLVRAVVGTTPLIARPRPMPRARLRRFTSAMPRGPCASRAPPFVFVTSR